MKRSLFVLFSFLFVSLFLIKANASDKQEENDYPKKVLKNGYIKVTVLLPDAENGYYRSTRFDWSGIIAQVEYEGHTYFQEWENYNGTINPGKHDPLDSGTGTGTVEEFRDPLGYDEAAPGNPFLKIGVGVLQRADEKPYHFAFPYKLLTPGKWKVKSDEDKISFFQEIVTDFGYAYQYEKIIQLSKGSPELTIVHTLKNTGKKYIHGNPYCHNFFRFDNQFVGKDYKIVFSNPVQPIDKFSPKVEIKDNQVTLNEDFVDAGWVGGHVDTHVSRVYSLSNQKTGTAVEVVSNVDPGPFFLFIWKMAFCVEPMVLFDIKPGESFTWNRTYKFSNQ
jgi:hypothetical protein